MSEIPPEGLGPGGAYRLPRPNVLDKISHAMMSIGSIALLVITIIVSIEVASRYFFHTPTIWAWDINVQLLLLMVMFGLAEVYRRDDYVRVDVLTSRLSPRGRAILDVLFAPILLFIAAVIMWMSWHYFHQSWIRNQHAATSFAPPLWPIKLAMPIGAAMLLAHGILKLVRDIRFILASRRTSPARKDMP